jgi:hypothetical protein
MLKHALLIGINYVNTEHALEGPLHDVYKIKETLVGYDTIVMTDNTLKPTKQNIVIEFKRLLQQKGTLFFYYSGHGIPDAIFCADSEIITRDEFRSYLDFMDKESTLVSILDTCYSGNLFDLTYHWAKDWINLGKPETKGHVYLISSSQDDELSFEHVIGDEVGGVFTSAYLKDIKHPQTWRSLMQKLTQDVKGQTPELSTGQRENIDDTFEI